MSDTRLGVRVRSDIPPLYKSGMRSQLYEGHELRMALKTARAFWGLPLDHDFIGSTLQCISLDLKEPSTSPVP